MPKEQSAGSVIFRITKTGPVYLLLHYPSGLKERKEYWDFPKGHMEKGETERQTAQREVFEETGLRNIEFLDGFREVIQYYFKIGAKTVFKTVVFFLAKTEEEKVKISFEHVGFVWLSFEKAQLQLKFKNAKKILTKAHHFLSKKGVRSGEKNPKG